jgi:CheY-like chemotaxis protein
MIEQVLHKDILIVDDDLEIRDTLSELLHEEGYSVATAKNGHEALFLLRERIVPRLILLDLMMPVMNGWQFRQEQQRDPLLRGIPVVVISATRAPAIDAAEILTKPIDLEVLLGAAKRNLRDPVW